MKKSTKVIFAILGGVNSVFYIFTPILISVVWLALFSLGEFYSYFIYTIGIISMLFRAIKVGGFIDDEDLLKRIFRRKDG